MRKHGFPALLKSVHCLVEGIQPPGHVDLELLRQSKSKKVHPDRSSILHILRDV